MLKAVLANWLSYLIEKIIEFKFSNMVTGRYRSQEKKNGNSNFEFGFFSSLAAVINSGEFWRCIRWGDRGSTLLITSPILFERDVLQNKHQELLPNVKDFPSFVDALVKMGFEKVLSEKLSKVQKFRHPCFKEDEEIPRRAAEKRAELKRKVQIEGNCQKRSTPVEKEKLTRRVAQSLNSNNDSARRAAKRKRNAEYSSDFSASVKERKNGEDFPSIVSTSRDKPAQRMRRMDTAEEVTAAQALLSLSMPVLLLSNYTAVELVAAQSLLDLSKSCAVRQQRSVRELESGEALLELFKSPCWKLFRHPI